MAKRKEKRREKRQERRERSPEERAQARDAAEAPDTHEERPAPIGVSWTGVIGAVMGSGALALIAIGVLIDPGAGSRWWALLFALPAVGFLPALRASLHPSRHRQRVQRTTVIGCLLLVFVASILLGGIGLLIAVVLMPPTALLAIAAGLIFQSRGSAAPKKRR